jgi:23S rRNA pseudouridine1911/1915/1917 synthase
VDSGAIEIDCIIAYSMGNADKEEVRPPEETTPKVPFVVTREAAGTRLDVFLARVSPGHSRSRLQDLIKQGFVRLNGASTRSRELLRTGDSITLEEPPPRPGKHLPQDIALDILHEDADLIVLNKPAGLVVHPGAGHSENTLVNALIHHSPHLSKIGGEERPGIVHRLDKDTSGCLVVAKNDQAHRSLSQQFAARSVGKVYLALVCGKLRKRNGLIEATITRHPVHRERMIATASRGRTASTEYRVAAESAEASMVECRIHSGRTHQVRVHLLHLGHPVLGDKTYAGKRAGDFPRQMLHAWKLEFTHPRSGDRKMFEAPLPDDFQTAAKRLGLQTL